MPDTFDHYPSHSVIYENWQKREDRDQHENHLKHFAVIQIVEVGRSQDQIESREEKIFQFVLLVINLKNSEQGRSNFLVKPRIILGLGSAKSQTYDAGLNICKYNENMLHNYIL